MPPGRRNQTPATPAPADALRLVGEARRIRSRFAGSPRQMHAALQSLVVRPPSTRIVPPPVPPQEAARLRFAREVLDRLDGPILRYSMRLELYKLARRLGLSTFDANLVIAQAQHAAGGTPDAADDQREPPSPRPWLAPLLVMACTQAAIVSAGWAIFC